MPDLPLNDHRLSVSIAWQPGRPKADIEWSTNPPNDTVPLVVIEALLTAVRNAHEEQAHAQRLGRRRQ